MKEQDIQKAILNYLTLKGHLVFKHHSTGFTERNGKMIFLRFGRKGVSDILGITRFGKFLAIEVKMPGKKASKDQEDFLEEVRRRQGIGMVANCLEDVTESLSEL